MPDSPLTDPAWRKILAGLSYLLVAAVIALGWLTADLQLFHAEQGLGYWLGVAGTTCMVTLLLYPLRKRVKALRGWGPVKHWFRAHMFLGVLGPVLIIFHSNFSLGSLNSRVALFSMLTVAGSGLIGRYLYSKLHFGLYGAHASAALLRQRLEQLDDLAPDVAQLLPGIQEDLERFQQDLLVQQKNFPAAFVRALSLTLLSLRKQWQLRRRAIKLLRRAERPVLSMRQRRDTQRAVTVYIRQHMALVRRIVQYRAFERLFSLWHVVHYPLFIFLVIAVSIHIVAVHMY